MHWKKHEQARRQGKYQPMRRYEKIAVAAIRHDGRDWFLNRPARHADVMRSGGIVTIGYGEPGAYKEYRIFDGEQGFLTNRGRFVDRYEGHCIAKRAGQLIPRRDGYLNDAHGAQLFSEDLW